MASRTVDDSGGFPRGREQEATPAQARWRILREALLSSSREAGRKQQLTSFSVRRFASFELFDVLESDESDARGFEKVTREDQSGPGEAGEDEKRSLDFRWLWYRYRSPNLDLLAKVAILTGTTPTLKDLVGFNNTGNVCLWPSEEVMAFFCLENLQLFTGASVCELGAGMAGLAGLFLACTHKPREVILTDGNAKSVNNLKRILTGNKTSFGATVVEAEVLLWDPDALSTGLHSEYCGRFDHILCADCLFFEEFHISLALLVRKLLRAGGVCHMFAPERGKSMQLFRNRAEEWFNVELVEKYSEMVWQKHKESLQCSQVYQPNIHYPVYLKLVPK